MARATGETTVGSSIRLLQATTLEEAERLFGENPDLDAILMDACLQSDEPNTIDLTRRIRQSFSGPMIACSGSPFFLEELMQAGCSHRSTKDDAAKLLLQLLGLA